MQYCGVASLKQCLQKPSSAASKQRRQLVKPRRARDTKANLKRLACFCSRSSANLHGHSVSISGRCSVTDALQLVLVPPLKRCRAISMRSSRQGQGGDKRARIKKMLLMTKSPPFKREKAVAATVMGGSGWPTAHCGVMK